MLPRLGAMLGLIALPSAALAHRLDEYLQATLVSIEPSEVRLHINLTPGVAVANQVLARIDRNHDGVITSNEAGAYAESVRRQILVLLDEREVVLNLSSSNFPASTELRTGWGIVQLEFSSAIPPLSPGAHKLTLSNRHLPSLSVYLLNAARPASGLVQITKQTRIKNQSAGEIAFVITQPESSSRTARPPHSEALPGVSGHGGLDLASPGDSKQHDEL